MFFKESSSIAFSTKIYAKTYAMDESLQHLDP